MKIWRDDITKSKLESGSTMTACSSFLLLILSSAIIYYPKVAAAACFLLAILLCILSVILKIKSKSLNE